MNTLITGSKGFIGSHLKDRLLKDGHKVTEIDRKINIFSEVSELYDGIDVVFHLAAYTRPQWSIEHPSETNMMNVDGTVKVLEDCKRNKVKRIVFASSSNIYGNQELYPTPETAYPSPMNMYALSKFIGEEQCKMYERVYGLEFNAIRPFNAYGTRMPITGIYTSAVATYINALKNDIPFVKFGDGTQRRDFVYIDDIVEQLVLMASSRVHGEAFNCGFGKNYSINEMFEMVCKIMGKRIEPNILDKQYEPSQTLADISKANKLLGWKPKVDLYEGLERTING